MILKDILLVSEGDVNYYFKRFKKALLLLNDKESDELLGFVDDFRKRNGLMGYSLRDLEMRMMSTAGIKVRTENDIKVLSSRQLALELADIDDWLDDKIKEKARTIRFSNPQDAFKPV